jgi:multiple sugar transport system ATP-binding protein
VRTAAEQLAIAPLLDRKPAAISGGERQRVALGRVLVRDADCNLFDEPLAHLDPPLVEQLQAVLVESHQRRPTTTLFVTHDQQEALALGNRIVVLAGGRIQQLGPPLAIYDRPANRFVAGFFGSPPMNFLNGRLIAESDHLCFKCGDLCLRLTAEQSQRLSPRTNEDIVAGIRPEAIAEADPKNSIEEDSLLSATVHGNEVRGDRVFHRLALAEGPMIVARGTTRRELPLNTSRQFHVDPKQLHVFESKGNCSALL